MSDTKKICDRCGAPATGWVVCWYGCAHDQCDTCAAQTAAEAREDKDMGTEINRNFITYLPLEEATKDPGSGHWEVYADSWWAHYPGKGLAFYRKSPQCNRNEAIARKVQKAWHPDAELIFVSRVYVRHDCGDYL